MTTVDCPSIMQTTRFNCWLIGVLFVLFQFFLQLSSGVIIGSIMEEQGLSALTAGLLSGSFYVVYTALQIPAGVLFDQKNARTLLSSTALLCAMGCTIFSKSTHLSGLFVGRILIGAGSSFAFVGLSHLIREYFPAQRFAFLIGLSETLGFVATAIGMMGMGAFIAHWGWSTFMSGASIIGFIIAVFCWRLIPNSTPHPSNTDVQHEFYAVITHPKLWINGLFAGLSFSVVTVFGALWAVPFIQIKLNCDMQHASLLCAAFFIGAGISCPLFGILANHVKRRERLLLSSCLLTAFLLLTLLYLPTHSELAIAGLMLMTGVCCGAYMLAYSISNELTPRHLQSTATGFTNTLAVLFAPILQPLIGYFLMIHGAYTLATYQHALLIVPASLFIASLLVLLLPARPVVQ